MIISKQTKGNLTSLLKHFNDFSKTITIAVEEEEK